MGFQTAHDPLGRSANWPPAPWVVPPPSALLLYSSSKGLQAQTACGRARLQATKRPAANWPSSMNATGTSSSVCVDRREQRAQAEVYILFALFQVRLPTGLKVRAGGSNFAPTGCKGRWCGESWPLLDQEEDPPPGHFRVRLPQAA